jgi:hypothetical protein
MDVSEETSAANEETSFASLLPELQRADIERLKKALRSVCDQARNAQLVADRPVAVWAALTGIYLTAASELRHSAPAALTPSPASK